MKNKGWNLKGNHGFDNTLESMRAIFFGISLVLLSVKKIVIHFCNMTFISTFKIYIRNVARGLDFKANTTIGPLHNVDIYPLICDILRINCNKNNGTMTPFLNVLESSALYYAQTKLTFN